MTTFQLTYQVWRDGEAECFVSRCPQLGIESQGATEAEAAIALHNVISLRLCRLIACNQEQAATRFIEKALVAGGGA
jgi:hypothetical protein